MIVYGEDKIYMKNEIPNTENQNKLISFSGSIMMFITIVISTLLPQLIQAAGKDAAAWKKLVLMIGIPCAVLGILRMVLVPECKLEEEKETKRERITIRESVQALFKNKYIMIFVAVYFLLQTTVGISNACGTIAPVIRIFTGNNATGDVLADILLGKSYPSGKLAMTWAPLKNYPSTEGFGHLDDTYYREGMGEKEVNLPGI